MPRIVVDTSVLIKWFKSRDEELVPQARNLLAGVRAHSLDVHVPALLLYEVGNVLLVKTRLDSGGLERAFQQLAHLPLKIAPPVEPLLVRAARLGRDLALTFYDASFLAVAVELDCPFVTADQRLFERSRQVRQVRHLSAVGTLV